jgi:CRP-like cAMP-binding protein
MKRVPFGPGEIGILAGMLREVQFLSELSVPQVQQVLSNVMQCSYKSGETVFKQGEPGDAFYIVYKGKVDIRRPHMVFLSKSVATLGPGQFFGEVALISQERRNATVVCTEPTLLFSLMSTDFVLILNQNPDALATMRAIAAKRKFISENDAA